MITSKIQTCCCCLFSNDLLRAVVMSKYKCTILEYKYSGSSYISRLLYITMKTISVNFYTT